MLYDFKNEDALTYVKSLQSTSIDLVLTDPPYAISRDTNFQSGAEKGTDVDRFRMSYDFGEWDVVDEAYRDWETDRKSTRLNSSHSAKSRMPSSA